MTLYLYSYISGNATKIAIKLIKIDETIANKFQVIPRPKSKGSQSITTTYETMIIDLKRLTRKVNVQGYLDDQTATINGSSTSITATEAKNYIEKYMLHSSEQTGFYWRGAAEDWTISNPTVDDISNRIFWGDIVSIMFSDEALRQDMGIEDYEDIKGSYSGTYPGDVKRYKVKLEFIVGTKR